MTWPPQPPNLSPIELVWDQLDRDVRKMQLKNIFDLFDYLKIAWDALPESYFKLLILRIPRICSAVIKAKGGYFNESKI